MFRLKWDENKAEICKVAVTVRSTSLCLPTSEVWESFPFLCSLDILQISNFSTYLLESSKSSNKWKDGTMSEHCMYDNSTKNNVSPVSMFPSMSCTSSHLLPSKRERCLHVKKGRVRGGNWGKSIVKTISMNQVFFLFASLSWCHWGVCLWVCAQGGEQLLPWSGSNCGHFRGQNTWVQNTCSHNVCGSCQLLGNETDHVSRDKEHLYQSERAIPSKEASKCNVCIFSVVLEWREAKLTFWEPSNFLLGHIMYTSSIGCTSFLCPFILFWI